MRYCKSVAVVLILMVQSWTMAPVLACSYCPPKIKPPPTIMPPPTIKPPPTIMPPPTIKPPPTIMPPPTIKPPPTIMPPPEIMPPPVTPTPKPGSCPIDALKLGACVDLLGGLVHIGLGDPVVNKCCPLLKGMAELEAALCLCTTIKLKLLNLNILLPLALELLASCGVQPPPGFTCPS